MSSFARLEEQEARESVEQALSALSDNLSNLNIKCSDWAGWDDTYKFIEDVNPEYVNTNLVDTTFPQLRLNLILFINNSGEVVYGKGFDLNNKKENLVPESIQEHLQASSPLLNHAEPKSSLTGIILLPEGPMLFSSRPIVTSELKGPIRGTLIMGRYLESKEIEHLSETTRLLLTFHRSDDAQLPSDIQVAISSLSEEAPILTHPLSDETIMGYTLIKDVYGKPGLLMRVDMPRVIYSQGQATILYIILSLLAVGVVFIMVTLVLLERMVLSRLVRLSTSIRKIGTNSDFSGRVSLEGRDELSDTAYEVNKMLESLEHSQQQLRESEEIYRNLFETMAQGVIYQDAVGKIISVNIAAQRIFGLTLEQMQLYTSKYPYWNAIREDRLHFSEETFPAMIALKTGRAIKSVVAGVYNSKEGKYRWININAVPKFRPKERKPYQVYITFDDITERKQMEDELKEHRERLEEMVKKRTLELCLSEERFLKAFNASPVPMSIIKLTNGQFIDLNKSFTRTTGYNYEEVIGRTSDELNIWVESKEHIKIIKMILEQGSVYNLETNLQTKLGEGRVGLFSGELVELNNEQCLLGVFNDITERKQVEKVLDEERQRFFSLLEELPAFIYLTLLNLNSIRKNWPASIGLT